MSGRGVGTIIAPAPRPRSGLGLNELLGLRLIPLESAAPKKTFGTHDVEDKGSLSVEPIEDAAGRFNDLAVACARAKLFGAAPALRVLCQLPNMLDYPLN